MNPMKDFVDYAVSEERMKKATYELFLNHGLEATYKDKSRFLQEILKIILTEESDTLAAHNFNMKKLNSRIVKKAREWYISNYCN